MSVRYDTTTGGFVIDPDDCPDCGQPLYMSGCTADGCNGLACPDCGTGCDYDFAPEGEGRCATALAEEDDDVYEERMNAERAALGLSPPPRW